MLTAWLRLAYCRSHNGNLRDISARFPRDAFKCTGINRPNDRERAAYFVAETGLAKYRRINNSLGFLETREEMLLEDASILQFLSTVCVLPA